MRTALRLGTMISGTLLHAAAQVSIVTVSGIVTDASGGLLPDTTVQLKNEQTGAGFSATSNDAGRYTCNFVPVGTYPLTANQMGFPSRERRSILLPACETVDIHLKLQVSSAVQQVKVTAEAPLAGASTSDQHQTITTRNVTELPTARFDWTNLLKIRPGVSKAGNNGVTLNGILPPGSVSQLTEPMHRLMQSFHHLVCTRVLT